MDNDMDLIRKAAKAIKAQSETIAPHKDLSPAQLGTSPDCGNTSPKHSPPRSMTPTTRAHFVTKKAEALKAGKDWLEPTLEEIHFQNALESFGKFGFPSIEEVPKSLLKKLSVVAVTSARANTAKQHARKQEKAIAVQNSRSADTQKKIIVGSQLMRLLKDGRATIEIAEGDVIGIRSAKSIEELMDKVLTSDNWRALFNLPVKQGKVQ